ncbi:MULTISPECIES: bifunctional adenosylcobinamide kinase/adenosylcobinamide-phosphate guanylyltransferase [Spirulina sp. CCY15215]|uniref:bifunctional adenosylcobinamide kinase/adenosylcobinamide-phosphate guanylyltransferase n=1 Tax=Spirulina sp. CCY15215 TaxID=2767591 RepID=UPI00194E3010|nr:bifunctional adenosylcobinamide kinase/adenosylcobinamide-phosphate guanylyltransferase [Spirulina major]
MSLKKSSRPLILVIGPASSGKSAWAEQLARDSTKAVSYVATAQENPEDPEWNAKIYQHVLRRPVEWKTLLVPVELAVTIQAMQEEDCFLVDSLGTWLANVLDRGEEEWEAIAVNLLASLQQARGEVILVAEETGWGLVPAYPLGRKFRDRLGNLTRRIGAIASTVYLVTGGYAIDLTQIGTPISHNIFKELS